MKKISFIILSFTALVLTSCLKDENITNREYGSEGIGEIPLVLFPSAKTTTSLSASNTDTSFHLVTVRLAEPNPASEDVQVTLVPNNAAVTAAGFSVAPASAYKLDNLVVTIPAGKREGYVTITTKTANLTSATYGFGFDISSISNPKYAISATGKTTVSVLPVKNKYDGDYTLKIKTTGWAAFAIADGTTGTYPSDIALITTSGNSVILYNYTRKDYLQPAFGSDGAPTAFGAATPMFTFDNATNKLTAVTNTTPDDGRGRAFELNTSSGINNRYDPATKTIYAAYYLKQTGRPDMAIYDTLVYKKARK
jgi:hypothetical protein